MGYNQLKYGSHYVVSCCPRGHIFWSIGVACSIYDFQ